MKKLLLLSALVFSFMFSSGQDWVELKQKTNANLYDIQKAFNEYWKDKDVNEKGNGYKAFRRWENFVAPRVYPSGDLSVLNQVTKNFEEYLSQQASQKGGANNMIASTTWTAVGPMGPISGSAGGQLLKSGRLNFITIHPAGTNTLFVGAPCGGLWKSTNAGVSWTTNTDNLTISGCSDLAIDPTNTNIMYLATGDGDAGDYNSIGVLKSIDGGNTWATTGLTFPLANNYLIRRLIINPSNTQIILAATNGGIYRTVNGGTNWSQVSTANTYDLEFKPGAPTTVYSAGTSFRVSNDGGATFVQVTTGITTTAQRMSIGVTPANANYVYVNASNSGGGFLGMYRSTNSGAGFTLMSSTPNIMGWNNPASGTTGQGWYDNCCAASPLNADEVVIGGVNIWRSTNGGVNWTCIGHWTGSGAPFTHADIHDVEYSSGGTLYNTNDGTAYRYTGAAWTEISGTMNISQIYKIGLSALTQNLWITGHQDNGTSTWNGTTYQARIGGDGMDCFIDRTNSATLYGSLYYADYRKSTNGGVNWSTVTTGLTGTAPWVSCWKQDPVTAATLYAGLTNLFKSTNAATSWVQLTAIPGTGTINEFAVAPSNPLVIYVLKNTGVYKTINGGTSWTNVTGTIPIASGAPTNVCIDPTDPNNAWVTLSGFSAGNKVFVTTNGGTAWTAYSTGLPNLPTNCIVYQPGTPDRVYVGMDVGVYYRDNTQTGWTLYNAGLPNTPVSDLEITPAFPTRLHAATFGRGVWVVDLVPNNAPPVSSFSVASGVKCTGTNYTFNDQSSNTPTSWSWSSNPATGVTITTPTSQNPIFNFANAGTYTVTLIASNGNGAGNTYTQAVTVNATPVMSLTASQSTVCAGTPVTLTASGASTYSWTCGSAASCTQAPTGTTTYTAYGWSAAGCPGSKTLTVYTTLSPTVNATASKTLMCSGTAPTTLTATGATTYTWNPGALTGNAISVTPSATTIYTVTGANSGCSSTRTISITYNQTPTVTVANQSQTVCAGTPVTFNATGATTYVWSAGGSGSGGNWTYNPSSTTTYSVTGYSTNGCVSAVRVVTANIIANPTVNTTASNTMLCVGQSVNLNATGAVTYTWNPGALSGASVSYTPATTTAYTVTGTGTGGCTGTNVITVFVSTCAGLNNGVKNIAYSIYPNPTGGKLTIQANVTAEIHITAEVIDVIGKTLIKQGMNYSASQHTHILDLGSLPSGLYFIKLSSPEGNSKLIRVVKD